MMIYNTQMIIPLDTDVLLVWYGKLPLRSGIYIRRRNMFTKSDRWVSSHTNANIGQCQWSWL